MEEIDEVKFVETFFSTRTFTIHSSIHMVACEPKSFLKVLSTEKNGALFYVIRGYGQYLYTS
jgi:hypothetical protein